MLLSLVDVEAIVEGQATSGGWSTSPLVLYSHKFVDTFNKFQDSLGDYKVINLMAGEDRDAVGLGLIGFGPGLSTHTSQNIATSTLKNCYIY